MISPASSPACAAGEPASIEASNAFSQSQQQDLIYQARDKVLPALVHIQPVVKDYNTGELKKQSVVGSGVIFHPDGYVVTNYHVAGKAERIICTLNDKEQVTADNCMPLITLEHAFGSELSLRKSRQHRLAAIS